jgi:hypothetical protein
MSVHVRYIPETEPQRKEWRTKSSLRLKEICLQNSKTVLSLWVFLMSRLWSTNSYCRKEGSEHLSVLGQLLKWIFWMRLQFPHNDSWFCVQASATYYSAMIVKCLLAISGLVETSHQLYSPYFLPANIFLIPKVKNHPSRKVISGHWVHQDEHK